MVLALKYHLIYSTCCNYLQSLNCIILPHPSTLRRFYGTIGLECELKTFLLASTLKFKNNQKRNFALLLDEIHVKSEFSYNGGRILGSLTTHTEVANTVLSFMISILCKKWSTVVRLLPCANSSAAQILPILHEVVKDVKLSSSNTNDLYRYYPLNVKLFKLLSTTSILESSVPHPLQSSRPLFLIFDFVHIFKTVRNNWINQIILIAHLPVLHSHLTTVLLMLCFKIFEIFLCLNRIQSLKQLTA